MKKGFTLIEMLVVIALIGVLSAILFPAISKGLEGAKSSSCKSNLRQMFFAYTAYLDDHNGRFFKWRETKAGGTQWYWGFEAGSSTEGSRGLDKSQAVLAPYFAHAGAVEVCPALNYSAAYFKQKYEIASYGYGLNVYMLSDMPEARRDGVDSFERIQRPSETIVWGDAAQINTWQAPASAGNPMLEEWYFLSSKAPGNFHFRHGGKANMIMADGSVRSFEPHHLDPRCDGKTGFLEAAGSDYFLRLVK